MTSKPTGSLTETYKLASALLMIATGECLAWSETNFGPKAIHNCCTRQKVRHALRIQCLAPAMMRMLSSNVLAYSTVFRTQQEDMLLLPTPKRRLMSTVAGPDIGGHSNKAFRADEETEKGTADEGIVPVYNHNPSRRIRQVFH